jgi:hypothetical protein
MRLNEYVMIEIIENLKTKKQKTKNKKQLELQME